jgi:hypothetical protein
MLHRVQQSFLLLGASSELGHKSYAALCHEVSAGHKKSNYYISFLLHHVHDAKQVTLLLENWTTQIKIGCCFISCLSRLYCKLSTA